MNGPTNRDARPLRPRPSITEDNAFFFEGAKRGELLVQRCDQCATLTHPPAPMCRHCGSFDVTPTAMSGRGTVYSFVVHHHPQLDAFDYPLLIGLVELEEGPRLVTNLVQIDPDDVEIDLAVDVVFEAVDDELTLPMFAPRPS